MAADAQPLQRLRAIKHFVVLMMENRSFDHMLGYLTGAGMPDVEGLSGAESNPGPDGRPIAVFPFDASRTEIQRSGEALQKRLDPCHSPECVRDQLEGGNRGFVTNFVASRNDPTFPKELWKVPMGYYTGKDLVTYDHLARTYCVCDAWHASIPGDTFPNRLYSVAGQNPGLVWDEDPLVQAISKLPFIDKLRGIPLSDANAFTRWLGDDQWRWYSYDPASLRGMDGLYRDLTNPRRGNFSYVDRRAINLKAVLLEKLIVGGDSFLDDAANGRLPAVSWIDPNFVDLNVFDPHSNDDHPPSDILAGQQLVFDIYDALAKSPGWDDTLLVITYDEHGGFYDHVAPPEAHDAEGFSTLGVRVPALVVGPRVRPFVCKQTFDHTALIRTALRVALADPEAAIGQMGGRVAGRDEDLSVVLEDAPRAVDVDRGELRDHLDAWRVQARARRAAFGTNQPAQAPDGAGHDVVLTDFQEDCAKFVVAMREAGHEGP